MKISKRVSEVLSGHDFQVNFSKGTNSIKNVGSVSCQPAGRRLFGLLPASYWNTDKEMAFLWHNDIKL